MDIIDAVLNVGTTIGNWFGILIKTISNLFSSIINLISYLIGIIKALFYGLGSLLSGVRNLIVDVFDSGVFSSVGQVFNYLIPFIGVPGVVFISSLLLIIIFRIGVAFVFKILRLNINYHSLKMRSDTIKKYNSIKDED